MRRSVPSLVVSAWMLALLARPAAAQAPTTTDLKRMTLQDLLELDVTTQSRGPEPTMRVPAAVYVITQDDIRRSGATSLPEALRLAPGVQIARINGGTWSVGMRGFADRLARSMLVLIDGRAVYSPLFAGTYWETQDVLFEDIDRIEVINGPGGTLWGANAVNGIINVITKSSQETTGIVAKAGGGSSMHGLLGFQYGAMAGPDWTYRVYGKGVDRGAQAHSDGLSFDTFQSGQTGFRADWTGDGRRTMTVQGDLYSARLGERATLTSYTPPFTEFVETEAPLAGGDVLARWSAPAGAHTHLQVQSFYARTSRDEVPVGETRDTFDVDVQQLADPWHRQQLTWGGGYRVTSGRITAIDPSAFLPSHRTDHLYSAFAQDDIDVVAGKLQLTVGTKVEHNDYSGVEWQPSVRALWTPNPRNAGWLAVTKAVRTPSRVETDYTTTSLVSPAVPTFVRLLPNSAFTPERLIAYETGYRLRLGRPLFVSFAGFYNQIDDVLSTELLPAFTEPQADPVRLILPVTFGNGLHGHSHGGEVHADLRVAPWWRWTADYAYIRIALSKDPGSADVSQERRNEGLTPRHEIRVRSSLDLGARWSADTVIRHVSALTAGPVPAYTTFDVSLLWRVSSEIELGIVGQDLAHAQHLEWASGGTSNIEVRRSGYVKVTWRR